MNSQPLVSIGIPTYNRPDGLRCTLKTITSQTYRNIEIIVSNNCSDGTFVDDVIEEFRKVDSRIISFKQEKNIGIINNFKFVLEKANGTYFMWASDDDKWSPIYIEELLSIIGDRSAAFSNYTVFYKETERVDHVKIVASARGSSKFEQARNFLQERIPSLFYGLYRTSDIKWFVKSDKVFDWFDCYLILKTILQFNGYAFSEKELYTASIQGKSYQYKPMNPNTERIFTYYPYFFNSCVIIFNSKIGFIHKLKLFLYLTEVNFRSFLVTEKIRKSYKFYAFIYKIFSRLRPEMYFYEH